MNASSSGKPKWTWMVESIEEIEQEFKLVEKDLEDFVMVEKNNEPGNVSKIHSIISGCEATLSKVRDAARSCRDTVFDEYKEKVENMKYARSNEKEKIRMEAEDPEMGSELFVAPVYQEVVFDLGSAAHACPLGVRSRGTDYQRAQCSADFGER